MSAVAEAARVTNRRLPLPATPVHAESSAADAAMKGPGFRLDLDMRRIWECPACGRRLKCPGEVTQIDCDCRPEAPVAMRLVEKCHRAESPFDHVGFAAQKRIDAALRKPHAPSGEETPADVVPPAEETPPPASDTQSSATSSDGPHS